MTQMQARKLSHIQTVKAPVDARPQPTIHIATEDMMVPPPTTVFSRIVNHTANLMGLNRPDTNTILNKREVRKYRKVKNFDPNRTLYLRIPPPTERSVLGLSSFINASDRGLPLTPQTKQGGLTDRLQSKQDDSDDSVADITESSEEDRRSQKMQLLTAVKPQTAWSTAAKKEQPSDFRRFIFDDAD